MMEICFEKKIKDDKKLIYYCQTCEAEYDVDEVIRIKIKVKTIVFLSKITIIIIFLIRLISTRISSMIRHYLELI